VPTSRSVFVAPRVPHVSMPLIEACRGRTHVLLDGTFATSDEMPHVRWVR